MFANRNSIPEVTQALEWRLVGPHRGGRVVAVAGDPHDPATFYFGACAGGVWKTTDGGTYWENVSDGYFRTAAVGAIAVSESDPNVIYAGMGETAIRGNVSHGDGVYKSTDAGKTWSNVGLADTRHIARVRIHPTNPDLVYVAALGHAWGPNAERGLYRSCNGGKNWEKVLFRSEHAGAIDLSMDPNNPRILYVSFWEAQRTPYSLNSGGPGSSLYKSTDGGDTWAELTNKPGLPTGVRGKIGVAVSPARRDRVWALVEAKDGALFRSDDGGENWQRLSESGDLRRRAWYYTHIYADPQDAETVWVLNLQCWKSVDGGQNFTAVPTPHGDNHDLWIDPHNTERMIEGNDGGACVTYNGGASWSTILNQPTAQFYHVTADTRFPYHIYGSQQDNTAMALPSYSNLGAITQLEWEKPGGGESGYIAVKPDNPNIIFGGAIGSGAANGRLIRYDRSTKQERNVTAWPEDTGWGDPALDLKYRFQWTFPIQFSPHDPNVLYIASNVLMRSTNEGASWELISPDLTRNDPDKLQASGGEITKDNTGAEVYCTIWAFAESPHEKGVFWVGTDDGLVHISRDGGKKWREITPKGLPEWALISNIDPSPHDKATVYMAVTRYKHDDPAPYLFKTTDYGKSWKPITNGIPANDFTRVIRADPTQPGVLYSGTETGVYFSVDDGDNWSSLQGNLPVAPIYDLMVKDNDLIAATHGRSFWILDDLTPIHQLAKTKGVRDAILFAPRETIRYKAYKRNGNKKGNGKLYTMAGPVVVTYKLRETEDGRAVEQFLDAGHNPPVGTIITYYLPEEPEGEVTLTFQTYGGDEIRRFSSENSQDKSKQDGKKSEQIVRKTAGIHRFVWDLRYPPASAIPGDKTTEDSLSGPVVAPGKYKVVLNVAGKSMSQEFEVTKDPRTPTTQTDFEAQLKLLRGIRDELSRTHDAVNDSRELRSQLEMLAARARSAGKRNIAERCGRVCDRLLEIEHALVLEDSDSPLGYQTRLNEKLATLAGFVDSADFAPTRQAQEVFDSLCERIEAKLKEFDNLRAKDIADINKAVRKSNLEVVGANTSR